jgi:hypothetical protein
MDAFLRITMKGMTTNNRMLKMRSLARMFSTLLIGAKMLKTVRTIRTNVRKAASCPGVRVVKLFIFVTKAVSK